MSTDTWAWSCSSKTADEGHVGAFEMVPEAAVLDMTELIIGTLVTACAKHRKLIMRSKYGRKAGLPLRIAHTTSNKAMHTTACASLHDTALTV